MKRLHFLGCLLLIIVITACEKRDEFEMGTPPLPSGQFTFREKTYELHYGAIRQNMWALDFYEILLYSYDKTVKLKLSFHTKQKEIPSGIYTNFGFTTNISAQQINAQLSLLYLSEEIEAIGEQYIVKFEKNTNGGYKLHISLAESPDKNIVYWNGKLYQ